MGTPFLGEIRIYSFNFAPRGWTMCNGALLPINQNQALFSLLGTIYGGDGRVTFALPDLRGRVPAHMGQGLTQGERAGEEYHTLSISELPAHTHQVTVMTANATQPVPTGNMLAAANNLYGPVSNLTTLQPASIGNVGGSQPHENRQPFLALNFCIALQGVFPSQT